ncbi:MAG: hypothetical protein KI790_01990 [Cyclobacteriaceae bacterium]|nr:hypothetical protein [Cyclobacteriaceae bacterium HetDA_MAG_MS6]
MKGLNLQQIAEFLADHKVLIQELKINNLRLQEIDKIDRKRLELLERPWWKRSLLSRSIVLEG